MTTTLRVLLAHPGTQYSGRLAGQLQRHHLLAEFYTGFAFSEQGQLARALKALPTRWGRKLANRGVAEVPPGRLHTRPWQELIAVAALRWGRDPQETLDRRNAAFQRSIRNRSIGAVDAVIGFDTSSWILARRARQQGRAFLLDQSIGHSRCFARVASRLHTEFPDWSQRLPVKSERDLAHEAQEHSEAACIVVPSRFVARTLLENGVNEAKLRVNPFGTDLELFQPAVTPPPLGPLRFVFAGSLGPRKGLPLLLAAWRTLSDTRGAELWVVGGGTVPVAVRREIPDSVRFVGQLSQLELSEVLRQCHVFVFPSYFEGLAQVQLEAAASGLAVIGTESSGCEEVVRHGETGFVLPTGDEEALRGALRLFLANPELALAMRKRLISERSRWSWDHYGDRWAAVLREIVGTPLRGVT